jgi:hypothetical protein
LPWWFGLDCFLPRIHEYKDDGLICTCGI